MKSVARLSLVALLVTAILGAGVAEAAKQSPKKKGNTPRVTIRTTEYGIPRILADNWRGLGYGYGFALAKENICQMADIYTTTRGERSKYFGPEGTWDFTGNGSTYANIDSDFFFKKVAAEGTVQKLLALEPPRGPKPEIKQAVGGYVDGYNRYLRQVGVDNLPDGTCRGADWVKPITKMDAYMRFYMLGILGSQGAAIDGIVDVSPPGSAAAAHQAEPIEDPTAKDVKALELDRPDIGSNAVALGSRATTTKKGMLLGNPHFPWYGTERFFESQITIPGEINASGASLLGVPVILIGHTQKLAWSHTVSTAYRFVPFEEKLVPGDPTSYYVDGQPRKMDSTTVTVEVKNPDGSIGTRSHTFYSTIHGPLTNSIQGQALFPWTETNAYAMRDVNADNFRYLNHFFDVNRSQSTAQLLKVLRTDQGVPWVNTIAADSKGNAFYADISVVPNVPDSKVTECNTPGIGTIAFNTLGLPVLDGSRSACDLQKAPGAVETGILPPDQLPFLKRKDYVTNSNDSYWLSNPAQPLEGFARIIGDERTERTLRTRLGLMMVQERLSGTDGQKGKRFDLVQVRKLLFNNRNLGAELFLGPLTAACQANPTMIGSDGPVNVSGACPVLAAYDGRMNNDSSGAVLWRRFMENLGGNPFTTPFDVNNPVYTPSGLNAGAPNVQEALADAVSDLNEGAIPLDAKLGDYQFVTRNGVRYPIHGGPGGIGTFNAISAPWNRQTKRFDEVRHGSSFMIAASMTGAKCPPVKTLLSYSQAATNANSRHYADQTRLYTQKKWVTDRFCRGQQLKSPKLKVKKFAGGAKAAKKGF